MQTDYRSLELSTKERALFYLYIAVAGMAAGWLFYDSLTAGAVIALLLLPARAFYARRLRQNRKRELMTQFRDLLYSLAASVSSGRSLGQALAEAVDFWQGTYGEKNMMASELSAMKKRMEEGNERDVELLGDFAARSGMEDAEDFALVCETCKKTGGNMKTAINCCADIIGDKIAMEKELYALAAQKRFEGRLISAMPFAITFFIKCFSPEYLAPLSRTAGGRLVTLLALAMIAGGWALTERINDVEI